jgi:adenylyl cyclase-associated protein
VSGVSAARFAALISRLEALTGQIDGGAANAGVVVATACAPTPAPAPAPVETSASVNLNTSDNTWVVENQTNNRELVVNVNAGQSVRITNCRMSTVQVKGTADKVVCENCTKTAVVVDNLTHVLEIREGKSIQVQALGIMPRAFVYRTDGAQIFLSEKCVDAVLVTSCTSEMNISVPSESGNGEFTEHFVPEQFKSVVEGGKLSTHMTEING